MPRDAQLVAFLNEVAGLWPVAKGSLTEIAKPCVRPACPACQRRERHPAVIFTYRQAGKQHCRYVPRALVPRLRRAIGNGRQIERRLVALGEALIFAHRRARTTPPAP
ncbi:MAG: hypothetical protein HYZ73_00855 [Elusimicrobia bacterium]|nr:hypothetical protein [Elusimicrobiota bacterium]